MAEEAGPLQVEANKTNLIINYLPPNMNQEAVRALFSSVGEVESCKLVREKISGESLGYAFVKFGDAAAADKAIRTLNGLRLQNKTVKVSLARPSSDAIKGANLYICGLPKRMSQAELERLFSSCGNIITARILYDSKTSLSRGVAFIRYDQRAEAEEAIRRLNGYTPTAAGEPITVKFASSPSSTHVESTNSASNPATNTVGTVGVLPPTHSRHIGVNSPDLRAPGAYPRCGQVRAVAGGDGYPGIRASMCTAPILGHLVPACPLIPAARMSQPPLPPPAPAPPPSCLPLPRLLLAAGPAQHLKQPMPPAAPLTPPPSTPPHLSVSTAPLPSMPMTRAPLVHQLGDIPRRVVRVGEATTFGFGYGQKPVYRPPSVNPIESMGSMPPYDAQYIYPGSGCPQTWACGCSLVSGGVAVDAYFGASTSPTPSTSEAPSPSSAMEFMRSLLPAGQRLVAPALAASSGALAAMGWCVCLANLAPETEDATVWQLVSPFGAVHTVKIVRDLATGRCLGFAFVTMTTYEEALLAIQALNGFQVGGRILQVSFKTRPCVRPEFNTGLDYPVSQPPPGPTTPAPQTTTYYTAGNIPSATSTVATSGAGSAGGGSSPVSSEAAINIACRVDAKQAIFSAPSSADEACSSQDGTKASSQTPSKPADAPCSIMQSHAQSTESAS